ncbi:MAG: LD-carboxypeptidase [bacterium]|nr:LD-carboxypeptidase [bacterium]
MEKLKPKALQKGDTIAIIAPSGHVSYQEKFETAQKYFENLGYEVKIFPNAKNKNGYLAGTDEERIFDLEAAFCDKNVKLIMTARGGYGAARILDKIDYKIIKNNPKIFCGYSDITAFHSAIYKKTGLVTFHAPFALADFGSETVDEYTERNFWKRITKNDLSEVENAFAYTCVNGGKVSGELVGGNLCVLTSILGSGFEPDFKNKILYIEDVNEPLYKIDRMLAQLRLNGIFKEIKGLLVGIFSSDEEDFDKKVIELLKELETPCGYGFSASHETPKATLPLNIKYEADFKTGKIKLLEDYLL